MTSIWTHMNHHSTFNVCYNALKSDAKRLVSTMGEMIGKLLQMLWNSKKVTPNDYVLKIKLIKSINNIPFIHKPLVFYLSIRIYQHYIGSQQGSGEMALFLHCLTFLCEIFWYLDLRVLWGWNTERFHVKMLNNEETMPFLHYLVVNQCNVDGFEWISKLLMVYGWMDCYWCIIWV